MIFFSESGQKQRHLSLGQEAVAAGFAAAMEPGDLSWCTYRGHAHTLARGVPIEVLGELMGRDSGLMRGKEAPCTSPRSNTVSWARSPSSGPPAHRAARGGITRSQDVSVCFFSDGTTNIGAFHQA
jgi:pyruvate dehydrogenase E1 component alpha subunit